VIIVKLADRLHNMRTLKFLPQERQERIAQETIEIYAPIAHRLGMGKVRGELEDLSFQYLEPEASAELIKEIESQHQQNEEFLNKMKHEVEVNLRRENIPARVEGRIKRAYSVYQKMKRQKIAIEQVYDLLALRIVTEGVKECYATLGPMKLAATHALAELAREEVPESVSRTYGLDRLEFGPEYIIPKPFDPRVLLRESAAVAKAAMDSGVAQEPVDLHQYREELERRLGKVQGVMRIMIHKAQQAPKRVLFTEGEESKILRAAQILIDEKIAIPILLGKESVIRERLAELRINTLDSITIVDPAKSSDRAGYAEELYRLRQRKGVTRTEAEELIFNHNYFGSMMVAMGRADALVGGLTLHYPETIRPALEVIPVRDGLRKVSGLYLMITQQGIYFLADATVNIEPSAEDLAEIAICAAETAERFNVKPRVALLSFSNFGSTRHPLADKVRRAVDLVKKRAPELMVDGEMQADTAVMPDIIARDYPFSTLKDGANVLIFPNLESGNVAYKLLARLGGAEAVGPILMGLSKPVHVLQRGAEVNEIVNVAAIAVVDAQEAERRVAGALTG
jgi:malate dehydrogenase (oxaloacetate-decarboxylating)(NADP+)